MLPFLDDCRACRNTCMNQNVPLGKGQFSVLTMGVRDADNVNYRLENSFSFPKSFCLSPRGLTPEAKTQYFTTELREGNQIRSHLIHTWVFHVQ